MENNIKDKASLDLAINANKEAVTILLTMQERLRELDSVIDIDKHLELMQKQFETLSTTLTTICDSIKSELEKTKDTKIKALNDLEDNLEKELSSTCETKKQELTTLTDTLKAELKALVKG